MDQGQFVSPMWASSLYTKGVAAKKDDRQKCPAVTSYIIPNEATRLLCAKLLLEETLETIYALGFEVFINFRGAHHTLWKDTVRFIPFINPDEACQEAKQTQLMDVIDGCCDTMYVASGILAACGVPDMPHLNEVCRANNSKFPNNEAVIDAVTGKYLKPEGWVAPDHERVKKEVQS